MRVTVHALGDESITMQSLADHVQDHGYVVFVSSRTAQRKMAKEIVALLSEYSESDNEGDDVIIYYEVGDYDWPMCVVDCAVMGPDEREILELAVKKAEESEEF